jgi:hypothetical protein
MWSGAPIRSLLLSISNSLTPQENANEKVAKPEIGTPAPDQDTPPLTYPATRNTRPPISMWLTNNDCNPRLTHRAPHKLGQEHP